MREASFQLISPAGSKTFHRTQDLLKALAARGLDVHRYAFEGTIDDEELRRTGVVLGRKVAVVTIGMPHSSALSGAETSFEFQSSSEPWLPRPENKFGSAI
jgi:hypothetical protein